MVRDTELLEKASKRAMMATPESYGKFVEDVSLDLANPRNTLHKNTT